MGLHGFVGPQFGAQLRPERSIVDFDLPEGVIHAAFFTIQRHMKLSLWEARNFGGSTVGFWPSVGVFCAYRSAHYDAFR
jgi:hypothetical protein